MAVKNHRTKKHSSRKAKSTKKNNKNVKRTKKYMLRGGVAENVFEGYNPIFNTASENNIRKAQSQAKSGKLGSFQEILLKTLEARQAPQAPQNVSNSFLTPKEKNLKQAMNNLVSKGKMTQEFANEVMERNKAKSPFSRKTTTGMTSTNTERISALRIQRERARKRAREMKVHEPHLRL